MTSADSTVERASRWVAARTTRRSFLNRAAQLAVVVAGGPTLIGLMARRAEARVCGQSGVSGKCATFDCVGPGRVWGWCWYASPGCCAGGGLKKICDCCTHNFPNVHGYCPAGYNVECIVESCWADPRVMTVPVTRIRRDDAMGIAATVSARLFPAGRGGDVVVADVASAVATALGATVAAAARAPLLLTRPGDLADVAVQEIGRLRASSALVVGKDLGDPIVGELKRRGLRVTRVGSGSSAADFSLSVARWVKARTGAERAVCSSPSSLTLPIAASAAAARRYPLVIGVDAARAFALGSPPPTLTYMVGGMADLAGAVPGGHPVHGPTAATLAREVATIITEIEQRTDLGACAIPAGHVGAAMGVSGARGVVLYHDPLVLDPANASWIRGHQRHFARGFAVGAAGALTDHGYYDFQSVLNHFDTHRLIGVSGQGLPVISQPGGERVIGRARIAGQPPAEEHDGYWVSRANPNR